MMDLLREDAAAIYQEAVSAVMPEAAVIKALQAENMDMPQGERVVIALGKAAWRMARAAGEVLGNSISRGLVITKHQHAQGPIPGFHIIEAGHPVPDHCSLAGARHAMNLVSDLTPEDQVILLISGGGSALFELPVPGVSLENIQQITQQLLDSGASISEINTIRKRLSSVKAGRFAQACGGARILSVVLSDVLGDRLDMIASGPAYPDSTTAADAKEILRRYRLQLSEAAEKALEMETPKIIANCRTILAGNVAALCRAAAKKAESLGYRPVILTTTLDGEASEAGRVLAAFAREINSSMLKEYRFTQPCALILGGETVVQVRGSGKGGRCQELALAAAIQMAGLEQTVLAAVGSDGTDGPTDAAGGMVDGGSLNRMREAGVDPQALLEENDAFHALQASGDLIITGPTGTNVNDLIILLSR